MSFIRGNSKLLTILFFIVVPLVFLGVTMQWNKDSNVTIMTDTLVGTTAAATTLDSTSVFEWHKAFTVTVGPGHNDTSFFTRGITATGYGDSIFLRFYLRGWTNGSRNQLVSVTPLWGYAAPYLQFARPRAHIWKSITALQQDSTTRYIIADKASFHLAGGVTTYDSTSYYYGDGRMTVAKGVIYVPYAPYYDVIMADSAAATGKSPRAKVTIVGFPDD